MTRVILASASSRRRKVLRGAGIDPLVIVSGVDEDALVAALPDDTAPGGLTTVLAIAKATSVARWLDEHLSADCVVIGFDSMLLHDGDLVGKPDSVAAARRQWHRMAGGAGELYTGHCVIRLRNGDVAYQANEASCTTVTFGTPSAAELDADTRSGNR